MTMKEQLIRGIMILIVFFILNYLYQRFIWEPIFRPDHKVDVKQLIRNKICPPGTQCECNI